MFLAAATKCLKDPSLDAYPVNVYYCNSSAAPECCVQRNHFECCPTQAMKTTNEQLAVWGSVFGIALVITIVWTCYRKDNYLCEGANLYQRFTALRRNKTAVEETIIIETTSPSHVSNETPTRHVTLMKQDREGSNLTSSGVQPTILPPTTNSRDASRESSPGSGNGACVNSEESKHEQSTQNAEIVR
ncbi:hypothetical protein NP493_812g00020 [Ridgeia piscesae]|uniref:Uncharacterized protein n=1 Tax=Ridgeia piscesae TaxID=27915 RepID=A0AAD9KMF6_RIDPI|nr:hypothetical protein NP493_812g00020 [Ridgeia piscesae]